METDCTNITELGSLHRDRKSWRFIGLLLPLLVCISIVGCGSRANDSDAGRDDRRTPSAFSADLAHRLEAHGAKTGDVQASLIWNNYNDLDIHIVEPSGEEIFFAHKRSRTGGELDVDMNAGGPQSDEPVENIYFPKGRAPHGRYRVYVHYYARHGSRDPTEYRCEVLVGTRVHKFSGSLSYRDPPELVYEFRLPEEAATGRPRRNIYRLFSPVKRDGERL